MLRLRIGDYVDRKPPSSVDPTTLILIRRHLYNLRRVTVMGCKSRLLQPPCHMLPALHRLSGYWEADVSCFITPVHPRPPLSTGVMTGFSHHSLKASPQSSLSNFQLRTWQQLRQRSRLEAGDGTTGAAVGQISLFTHLVISETTHVWASNKPGDGALKIEWDKQCEEWRQKHPSFTCDWEGRGGRWV